METTGRSGLLNYLIDADTLRSTGTEVANRNVDAVSANSFAYIVSRMGSPNQVLILTNGKSTQLEYETKCGLVQTQFVSTDVLAIFGCNRVTVINAARGRAVFRAKCRLPG